MLRSTPDVRLAARQRAQARAGLPARSPDPRRARAIDVRQTIGCFERVPAGWGSTLACNAKAHRIVGAQTRRNGRCGVLGRAVLGGRSPCRRLPCLCLLFLLRSRPCCAIHRRRRRGAQRRRARSRRSRSAADARHRAEMGTSYAKQRDGRAGAKGEAQRERRKGRGARGEAHARGR